ncbi:hypothetical protein TSOC_010720 [Tetrabaena socialis]|uniref:Uncharacterized protein n=1 Tax=Tetrabaena socialis TaxID=47790 RepID=A0A2J7ZSG3_9CHLO|nr:hypothetical protein TSOC_010720 [Tetrabaena socialis]|eukprot:PNH03213.1 hypothetical protein TSOC_010720 [Tetrabaena socialis]
MVLEGEAHVQSKEEVEVHHWRTLLLRVGMPALLKSVAWLLQAAGVSCSQLGPCFSRTLRLACAALPQQLRTTLAATENRADPGSGGDGTRAAPESRREGLGGAFSLAALRALLGPGAPHPDPAALADVEAVVQEERRGPEAAAAELLPWDVAIAAAALTRPADWLAKSCLPT